jgi:very-short-patch-repair endonuclease
MGKSREIVMEGNVKKIYEHSIKENFVSNLPYNDSLKSRAKALRKGYNYSEVVFWKQVRNKQFWNIDFDRQRIIGNYIVDFYVKKLGLIVEIDGESHNNKEDYDVKRELFLESLGLVLFKTTNYKVLHDLDNVMKELEQFIVERFVLKND